MTDLNFDATQFDDIDITIIVCMVPRTKREIMTTKQLTNFVKVWKKLDSVATKSNTPVNYTDLSQLVMQIVMVNHQ